MESVTSKTHQLWPFLKMFKIQFQFQKCKKISEEKKFFGGNSIWRCCSKLSALRREYLSSAVNALTNTNTPKIYHITNGDFFQTELPFQWSINMVKLLSFKFQQCFGLFLMLLVKGSCKTGLFRHISNNVFQSP